MFGSDTLSVGTREVDAGASDLGVGISNLGVGTEPLLLLATLVLRCVQIGVVSSGGMSRVWDGP